MRLTFAAFALALAPAAHAAGWPQLPLPPRDGLTILKSMVALADGDERDPAKLAARIGQNARAAGDLLAARDTGANTRRTQSQILRDIDRLLDQANDPPPPQGGGNPPPPDGEPPPPGEGGEPPPTGPRPPGADPSGAGQPKPRGAQPKPQPGETGGEQKTPRGRNGGQKGGQKPEPKGEGKPESAQAKPGQPGQPGQPGGAAGGAQPAKPNSRPVPPEDAIAKQVWGHLPERLRREMNQYYKEQFMPKYGDLLRDYYSGLAEARPAGGGRTP